MRPALLALALSACATPNPVGGDSGALPGPGFSGSTGQSGTTPLTCPELVDAQPQPHPVGYDETTPLGFTVEQALAPIRSTTSTLTWTEDGQTTGLTATLDAQAHGVNANYDPDTGELTACVGLTLLTDEGFLGGFSAERLVIRDVGLASGVHEGFNLADGGYADPDLRRRRISVDFDGGAVSGSLEESPPDGTPPAWELVATW